MYYEYKRFITKIIYIVKVKHSLSYIPSIGSYANPFALSGCKIITQNTATITQISSKIDVRDS